MEEFRAPSPSLLHSGELITVPSRLSIDKVSQVHVFQFPSYSLNS